MQNTDDKTAYQAELLQNRVGKRFRHLGKWAKRIGADAFRLYDRDIPEIPLVIDLYGDGISGALYARPYEKDEAEEGRWLDAMNAALSGALAIPREHIFLKQRKRQRGAAQYDRFREARVLRDVREGGLRFRVNLSDYLDPGLFLDRRKMRSLIRSQAAGKRVLNLFCYTAAFSVYAADGGAAEVDSVDLSNTYLDWAADNFSLNGFSAKRIEPAALLGDTLPSCRLIRQDALAFIRAASGWGLRWDLIILDPPSFSNSKKMCGVFDVRRDYGVLLRDCLRLLAPGGTLWFSVNARNVHLVPAEFPGWSLRDMRPLLIDEDFLGKSTPCTTVLTPAAGAAE
jgi:23S rRNA G2069 N7-methylase RlmK/C1962 C5-methylase RlmI